jgi:predicted Zn finger-like uncharacterized protein
MIDGRPAECENQDGKERGSVTMEITCDSCQSKFKIADEKIPAGKATSFPCPKCRNKITIKPAEPDEAAEAPDEVNEETDFGFEEQEEFAPIASESVFDFAEEEGKIALICESDTVIKEKLIKALDLLEYHVSESADQRDALRKLRYKVYDVVVLDEYFGTKNPDANGVLIYLQRLPMETRRNMFVTLVSDRYRTMDYMMAFSKSVNLIINKKNIDDVEKILSRNIAEYEMFYRIFKEAMQ